MLKSDDRRYFIVKRDLESFKLLPGFIWRSDVLPPKMPPGFRLIKPGDVWIEFAHTRDESSREQCRLITGFRRCVQGATFRPVPEGPRYPETEWAKKGFAWMIEGENFEKQPRHDVTVPPIDGLLGRRLVRRRTINRIWPDEFDKIHKETFRFELPPDRIPLLGRAPRCEQELLAIVIAGLDRLGIDRIQRVQVRFPDLLAEIDGKEVWLELELISLDFQSHGHIEQLREIPKGDVARRRKPNRIGGRKPRRTGYVGGRREAKRIDSDDNRPVAVLCWVDNDKNKELKGSVQGLDIFELLSLLRAGEKITLS